jgi:hypothetical protein
MQSGDILKIEGDNVTKVGSTLIGGLDNFKAHLAQHRYLRKQQQAIQEQIEKVLPDDSVLEYWNYLNHGDEKTRHLESCHLEFDANPSVTIDLDLTVEDPNGILCTLTRTWDDDDKESSDFTIPFTWLTNPEMVKRNLIADYNRRQQVEEQTKLEERRKELLIKKQAIEIELASL